MLVIRLARGGRSKYPVYRIVAAESSRAATGKFVEVLGHYNPHTKELVIKKEETIKRLSHGAQPSNSVIKLLKQEKIDLPSWVKLETKNRKPKNEPEEKPAPVEEEAPVSEEVPAEQASEAPVQEAEEAAPADAEERVAEVATDNAADVEEAKEDAPEAPAEETTNEDSK